MREEIYWNWEDAFYKFGFGDGDGLVMTPTVKEFISKQGYYDIDSSGGIHNDYIYLIKDKGGKDLMENVNVGYDDPRKYLPKELVEALDREFNPERLKPDDIKLGKHLYKVNRKVEEVFVLRADTKEEAERIVRESNDAFMISSHSNTTIKTTVIKDN